MAGTSRAASLSIVLHEIGLAAALGVGGFDPIGAVMLVAAVVAGARKRAIVAFTAGAVGIGLVSGMILALGVGALLDDISRALENVTGASWRRHLYAGIAITGGTVLIVWGIHLLRKGVKLSSLSKSVKEVGVRSMLVSGIVVGAGVLTNPPFYIMLVLAGKPDNIWMTFLLVLIFVLVAQSGMVIPTVAVLLGVFDKFNSWLQRVGKVLVPKLEKLIPYIVIVIGVGLYGFAIAEWARVIEI